MWVVVTGNPFEGGFDVHGPFPSLFAAQKWALEKNSEWFIVEVMKP